MPRTIAVTGAASGLGAATAQVLRERGDHVITVDLRGADVEADLSSPAGRAQAVQGLHDLAPGHLDGVVTWAGLGGGSRATLLVNYFGTVDVVEGVHDLLLASPEPRVVVTSSRMSLEPADPDVVDLLLARDLDAVSALPAQELEPQAYYRASKTATARWMRRTAVDPAWGGRGICVNAIAPGLIETPMTTGVLADPAHRPGLLAMHPQAHDHLSQPGEIAELAAFLISRQAGLLMGQCIFADRGTEAILRGDSTW